MTKYDPTRPQLSWSLLHECWHLEMPYAQREPDGPGYFMLISRSYEGHNYHFIRIDMGEEVQVVKQAQYNQMLKDIEEHEGEEMRDLFHQEQTHIWIERDDHPVFALQAFFEALITLNFMHFEPTWDVKNLPTGSNAFHELMQAKRQELWKVEQAMYDSVAATPEEARAKAEEMLHDRVK